MIVHRKWTEPEAYVEVVYDSKTDEVDMRYFTRDPRKAQHHKVKFWNRGLWMPWRSVESAIRQLRSGMVGHNVGTKAMLQILEEDMGRTSSDRRAAAS